MVRLPQEGTLDFGGSHSQGQGREGPCAGRVQQGHTWAESGLEGSSGWSLGERERPPPGWGLGAFTAEGLDLALGWASTLPSVVPLEVAGGPFLLRQATS